jgi:hypothetical protein
LPKQKPKQLIFEEQKQLTLTSEGGGDEESASENTFEKKLWPKME